MDRRSQLINSRLPEMNASVENLSSNSNSNSKFKCPNLDWFRSSRWNYLSFPCSSNYNWKKYIWQWVSILSCTLSVMCIIIIVCVAISSKQELEKINKTVEQNRKYIAATQRHLDYNCLVHHDPVSNPNYNKTKRVTLGCGGIIALPPAGNSILLDFKSQTSYEDNENCLWVLDSTTGTGRRYPAKIKITMMCEGFGDEDDGVYVFDWIDWESLASFELNQNKDYTPGRNSAWHYLSFTSNNDGITGTGFVLKLDILETSELYPGKNEAFTNSTGTVVYGPPRSSDRLAIVINPPLKAFSLTVDYLESRRKGDGTCDVLDSLHIFAVGAKGSHTTQQIMCGSVTNRRFQFQKPILVGFVTSSTPTGRGFKLSWMES